MSAKLYFKLYANVSESVMGMFEDQIIELMEGYGRAVLSEYRAKESYKGKTVALDIVEVKPLQMKESPAMQSFVLCNCKELNMVLNGMGEWICEKCSKRVIQK